MREQRRSFMKTTLVLCCLMMSGLAAAAERSVQEIRLQQYAGVWLSAISVEADDLAETPAIKMINQSKQQGRSLQVEVLLNRDGKYVPILLEQISYDSKTGEIVASGKTKRASASSAGEVSPARRAGPCTT
jgi:hypothetical protein